MDQAVAVKAVALMALVHRCVIARTETAPVVEWVLRCPSWRHLSRHQSPRRLLRLHLSRLQFQLRRRLRHPCRILASRHGEKIWSDAMVIAIATATAMVIAGVIVIGAVAIGAIATGATAVIMTTIVGVIAIAASS